jgi:hypothetical protein
MDVWEVMAHVVALPISPDDPVFLPPGWEPIAALARQGPNAVVMCRRQSDVPILPPSGPPVLDSLNPDTLAAGGTPATIDVLGSNFESTCEINVDGQPRGTFFLGDTHLQYTARPDLATSGQTAQITVVGAGGTSDPLPFTYT